MKELMKDKGYYCKIYLWVVLVVKSLPANAGDKETWV